MASGIAAELNKVATLGLAPIVFGPVMNTTAATIANWWRTHSVEATDVQRIAEDTANAATMKEALK